MSSIVRREQALLVASVFWATQGGTAVRGEGRVSLHLLRPPQPSRPNNDAHLPRVRESEWRLRRIFAPHLACFCITEGGTGGRVPFCLKTAHKRHVYAQTATPLYSDCWPRVGCVPRIAGRLPLTEYPCVTCDPGKLAVRPPESTSPPKYRIVLVPAKESTTAWVILQTKVVL